MKSLVWGNDDHPITQNFGVYNQANAEMYGYAAYYGWPAGTHIGLDVGMPRGTDIFAAEPGEVIQAGESDSFRPMPVWVKEDDGDTAIYGHLWTNDVTVGDRVHAGQKLGTSGEQTKKGTREPDKTGPHLHFELRDSSGMAVNPVEELSGAEGTPESGNGVPVLVWLGALAIGGVILLVIFK